jgi:hypothetical protein
MDIARGEGYLALGRSFRGIDNLNHVTEYAMSISFSIFHVTLALLISNLVNSALAESVDFHLLLNQCKLVLASTNKAGVGVSVGEGDPVTAQCSRQPRKATCKWIDGKGKIFDTEVLELVETETWLYLTNTPASFIKVDTATRGVVSVQKYFQDARPDIGGSKVCSGVYASGAEIDLLKKTMKEQPKIN